MYWNILVWLRIEIPDGFLHQISENLKIDDLVTGGTINLQLTLQHFQAFNSHSLQQIFFIYHDLRHFKSHDAVYQTQWRIDVANVNVLLNTDLYKPMLVKT